MKTLLKIVAAIIAALAVLVAVVVATSSPVDEPTEPTTTETAEPMQTYKITETGPDILVEFEVRDQFTAGLVASHARRDIMRGIEQAHEEHPDYERIIVRATKDGFNTPVVNAAYSRATVEEMDFSPADAENILELRTSGSAHPDLSK